MPRPDADILAIPAFLADAARPDDAALRAWKQAHPDWFVAGTWTEAAAPEPAGDTGEG